MEKQETEAPNIGKMLNYHVRKHRYHQAALARDIGVRHETVANFLKRPDNRISYLWRICFALRYNFFSDIAALLPPDMPCAPTAKDQRIAQLEIQLNEMTTELLVLQRVVEALKNKG